MRYLYEYLSILIPVGAVFVAFYTNVNVRLKALEIQVKDMIESKRNNDEKYDRIIEMLSDLRVEMQNKKNRD